MTNIPQLDAPSFAPFSILLAMSAASFVLSVLFYAKLRAARRLPKDLRASIFSRTFNVFDPFPEKRRTFHSYLFFTIFSPLMAFSWTFFIVFVVILRVFQAGFIAAFVLFIFCLSLMMTSEAFEVYSNTSKLLKSVRSGIRLGKGDMAVLYFAKKALIKLSKYYLVLACVFTTFFFTAPLVSPMFMIAFASFVEAITASTTTGFFLSPLLAVFLLSVVVAAVYVVARRLRALVFDFPLISVLASSGSADMHARLLYEKRFEAMEANPDEITW